MQAVREQGRLYAVRDQGRLYAVREQGHLYAVRVQGRLHAARVQGGAHAVREQAAHELEGCESRAAGYPTTLPPALALHWPRLTGTAILEDGGRSLLGVRDVAAWGQGKEYTWHMLPGGRGRSTHARGQGQARQRIKQGHM